MDTPQAPAAPDPKETAAAQAAANKDTAITQYGLNATNQVTPQGTLTYNQIGTWADGTPRYEAVQSYSPQQQALYDKYTQTQSNLGDLGNTLSSQLKGYMATPFDANGASKATADNLAQLGAARLDPQFQRDQQSLETQLVNKGIRPGTAAWDSEMARFSNAKNDAYNQLYLTGQQQAYNQALQTRNQPINEITALLSGSQVSNPNYASTPTPGVAPTDVIGAQQQSLNQQNVGYQGQLAQNNALTSGLFGLGSAALGGWAYGGFKR